MGSNYLKVYALYKVLDFTLQTLHQLVKRILNYFDKTYICAEKITRSALIDTFFCKDTILKNFALHFFFLT